MKIGRLQEEQKGKRKPYSNGKAALGHLATDLVLFVIFFHLFLSNESKENDLPRLRYRNSRHAFKSSYNQVLEEFGFNGRINYVNLSKPLPTVTFVSAVSENHAGEGRSLVVRLAKDHPDWKIHIYDLGLSKRTRKWFQKACNVKVRDIDLAHFGVYFLNTYQWKPLIIADALKEFPVVFWMDSSTFWAKNANITNFIRKIGITHQDEGPHVYLIDIPRTPHSTFAVTAQGMYDFLSPAGIDLYKKQHQAGKMLYIRTRATYELALKWFVLCGLEVNCMAPRTHRFFHWSCHYSDPTHTFNYAGCHRYDQSAINLILSSYPGSFLGNWTGNFTWTWRVNANEEDLNGLC